MERPNFSFFKVFRGGIWECKCVIIEVEGSPQVDQTIIFRTRKNPNLKRVFQGAAARNYSEYQSKIFVTDLDTKFRSHGQELRGFACITFGRSKEN